MIASTSLTMEDHHDYDSDSSIEEALNDAETYLQQNKEEEEEKHDDDEEILAAFDEEEHDDGADLTQPPQPELVQLSSLSSSIGWAKALVKCKDQHEDILKRYESQSSRMSAGGLYQHAGTSDDSDPINIICMDGGGMRGYCHTVVVDELQKMMTNEDGDEEEDLMQYFDLSCGTSVGGIAALMQGRYGTKRGFHQDASKLLDRIRERSFKRFSGWSLFFKGTLTTGEDKVAHILEDFYGDTPLYNPGGLRAFALCTTRKENGPNKEATFEPFVLRSYDLKEEDGDNSDDKTNSKDSVDFKVEGTNEVLLWEAMAATSAAPVLTERVQLTLNGEKQLFADGCVVSNSPVIVAMAEARRLWPKRPLGVILMLGLTDKDDDLIERAMEVAKLDSPDLQYLRLVPPIKAFLPTETKPERIREMQQVAVENVRKNATEVKAILSKLKASGSRRSEEAAKTSFRKNRMSVWTTQKSRIRRASAMLTSNQTMMQKVARRMTMRHSVKLDLKSCGLLEEEDIDQRGGVLRVVIMLFFVLVAVGYSRCCPGGTYDLQTLYESCDITRISPLSR